MKQATLLTALPGGSKTGYLLQAIKTHPNDKYAYTVPTIALADEVEERATNLGITTKALHSGNGSTLLDIVSGKYSSTQLIVITHKMQELLSDTKFFDDRMLVVDELPSTVVTGTYNIPTIHLPKLVGTDLRITDGKATLENIQTYENWIDVSIEPDSVTKMDVEFIQNLINSTKGKGTMIHHGSSVNNTTFAYWEVSPILESMLKAPELAVLNSMVGTTWLETLLKDKVTFTEVNIDTPLKFPMVLRPYSDLPNTRAALEPELKNLLTRISKDFPNETILTQAHGWGTNVVKGFNNMLDIGFDVRGRNGFSKFTHTAHLIHGNANPIEVNALNDLGEHYNIDAATVRAITQFERLVNPTLQHMMRTNVRTRQNQVEQTVHCFGTLAHAQMIADTLVEGRDFVWDMTAMKEYNVADKVVTKRNAKDDLTLSMVQDNKSVEEIADALAVTEERAKKYIAKANKTVKLVKKTEAIKLHAKGMSKSDIAIELNISRTTLDKYLTE